MMDDLNVIIPNIANVNDYTSTTHCENGTVSFETF